MEEIYTSNLADGTTNETQEPLSLEDAQINALSTLAETAGELSRAVQKIAAYVPTQWVDRMPPRINAQNLMHIENGIKTATDAVNNAIDSITELNGSMFPYRSRFTGDFNSNNILPGIYHIDSSDTYSNGPVEKPSYCNFIQFQGYHGQMIIDRSNMYLRKYTGNPPSWGTWETFKASKWNKIGSLDLTNEIQIIPYDKNNVHEILVSYGTKNSVQAYGGGTVVIAADEIKPCYLPSYEQDLIGIAYIYNHDGKIEARSYSATSPLRVNIWVR